MRAAMGRFLRFLIRWTRRIIKAAAAGLLGFMIPMANWAIRHSDAYNRKGEFEYHLSYEGRTEALILGIVFMIVCVILYTRVPSWSRHKAPHPGNGG